MTEIVGGISYTVTLETAEMLAGQRRVDAALNKTRGELDSFGSKLNQITQAIKVYAAATFLISNTDAYTKLNAQLKLATDGHSSLAVAQDTVRRISREAQSDINSIAVLYARITNATKELRTSQFAVGEITRVVALSLKVSGASAAEASSAMLQLSQSFASGVMRGEEFNSVSEAAPRLMKALADGIGVPIGRLRAMAEAGKLTTRVLVDALPKALGALEEEAKHVQTISGAFQVLKNEVMLFVGAQTTANGSAAAAASALSTLAQNLDLVAAAAIGLTTAKLASTILAFSVATVASTRNTLEATAVQRANAAASVVAAQAKAAETAATVVNAEAELASTGAKIAGLQATQGAIVASRADVVQKLLSARAAAAQATAQMAAAAAAGSQSYALAMLRTATAELAVAQATQARMTNYLATLGQQQAAVAAQITAATTAQTAASRGLTAAQGSQVAAQFAANQAITASTGIMATARAAMGLLGGPIGIITGLLGLGATAWALWGNSAEEAGDKAAAALAKASKEQSAASAQRSRADDRLAEEMAKGDLADPRRIAALQRIRDRANAAELAAQREINGVKAEAAGRERLDKNYVARYEKPQVRQQRERDAVDTFKQANQTPQEKYDAELKELRGNGGDAVDADAIKRLRAKHHLDKPDKSAGKADGAKQYYEGLVADNAFALAKIDAQEREALAENQKRAAKDGANASTYAAAKVEIHKKFARERAQLEEKTSQQVADLNIATTTDETAKVEMIRSEAIRRADAAEKIGTMSHAEAQRARTLAEFQAGQARGDLAERNAQARADAAVLLTQSEEQRIILIRDEAVRRAEAAYERGATTFAEFEEKKVAAEKAAVAQHKELAASRTSTMVSTLQLRAEGGGVEDKVALIQAQAAAELAATEAARLKDVEASQIYADKKVAIEVDMNRRIADARTSANQLALTSTSDAFGSIANVLKSAEGEQSGIYEVMFAAQKAFAIASAIVAIQTGIAQAAAVPFPANIAAMASVAAATASIISTISGTSYGGARQYGGPTQAGSLYRVNETGAPEMFTASNGNQFMLGGKSGSVTPADQVGGGGFVFSPTYHIDGTADRAATMAQMQKVAAQSNKQLIEQMKRMKVLPP